MIENPLVFPSAEYKKGKLLRRSSRTSSEKRGIMTHVPYAVRLLVFGSNHYHTTSMNTDSASLIKSLLLVDDDVAFCTVLGSALRRRGFRVHIAHDIETASSKAERYRLNVAILDLNLGGESALQLIPLLRLHHSDIRVLMLTGYASIVTAVEATKLGAKAYLIKPSTVDEILFALTNDAAELQAVDALNGPVVGIDRVMQKNLQLIVRECAGNISAAARKLGMHRRSLQRKLSARTANEAPVFKRGPRA